ncbi:hypothetical protein LJC36_00160 [Desulfovibrio sp. OttesenSCG-928-C14]|nr:hypothetical protein [Desulfovibrio sp. OttesenSCG-928-C14]
MAMLKALGRFFVDDVGEPSCMRLVTFLVPVFILGVWAGACLLEGRYTPLGYSEAGLISSCLFAKAAQSKFEGSSPPYKIHQQNFMPSPFEGQHAHQARDWATPGPGVPSEGGAGGAPLLPPLAGAPLSSLERRGGAPASPAGNPEGGHVG